MSKKIHTKKHRASAMWKNTWVYSCMPGPITNQAPMHVHGHLLKISLTENFIFCAVYGNSSKVSFWRLLVCLNSFDPLSANPSKWSNILKQFVGNLPTNCLSVFDHFAGLALKGLRLLLTLYKNNKYFSVQYNSPDKIIAKRFCKTSVHFFSDKKQNVRAKVAIFWEKQR